MPTLLKCDSDILNSEKRRWHWKVVHFINKSDSEYRKLHFWGFRFSKFSRGSLPLKKKKKRSSFAALIRVYPRFKLIWLDRKRLSSFFFVGQLGFWPRIRHYKSDKGKKNSLSRRCKMLYTTGSRVNIGLRLTFWRHKWKRLSISEQANNFQDGGMLFAFLTPL